MGVVVLLLCLATSAYVAAHLIGKVVTALRTGTLKNRNTIYVQRDDRLSFWFNIFAFAFALLAIMGFWMAVLSLGLTR
jgi:hypothetical protein